MLFFIISLSAGCKKRFANPPATETDLSITLDRFLDGCNTTINGSVQIPYTVKLIIWYWDTTTDKYEQFHSYDMASPTTPIKQPITIPTKVPVSGLWYIEVNIQGEQCSVCADKWGGAADPAYNCFAMDVQGGKRVAIPRWRGFFGRQNTGTATMSITNIPHQFNVPNSCGCVVPY